MQSTKLPYYQQLNEMEEFHMSFIFRSPNKRSLDQVDMDNHLSKGKMMML